VRIVLIMMVANLFFFLAGMAFGIYMFIFGGVYLDYLMWFEQMQEVSFWSFVCTVWLGGLVGYTCALLP